MAGYDWAFAGDRGGESIEGLIATFLVLEFPGARQVNPSQGDGGVDILLPTQDGLEIWQVKKFLNPLTSSQWTQVKNSWARFRTAHADDAIARYHLVTPWTPTDERHSDFVQLTADAPFPTQWDGEAYINGLADKYPATFARFMRGPAMFEQFVNEKAMLAQSPVETANSIDMLSAIEVREAALDDLRNLTSDSYWIDTSTRTVDTTDAGVPPMPDAGDPGVFHQITYLGDNRWRTVSLVPRNADAAAADPLELEVTYLVEEGSEDHQALIEWAEWGTPFKDIPARTVTRGGPLDGQTNEQSLLSFVEKPRDLPPLDLVIRDSEGAELLRLPLTSLVRTQGTQTGWLRLVAETPQRLLRLELRVRSIDDFALTGNAGNVEGLQPSDVLDEVAKLASFDPAAVYSIELHDGGKLIAGTGIGAPSALTSAYEPIAQALVALQASTTAPLLMPDISDVTAGQLQALLRYATLYNGTPERWSWTRLEIRVPDAADEAEQLIETVRRFSNGSGHLVQMEQPLVTLGTTEFRIERPIVSTALTHRIEGDRDVDDLRSGDEFALVPGDDDSVITAAIVDWTPGSIDFFNEDEAGVN